MGLVELDRDLLDAVDTAGPVTQRALARWAARRALSEAGLSDVDWIVPALDALDHQQDLPASFDDAQRTWDPFFADDRIPQTLVDSFDASRGDFLRQAMAIPALFGAAETDPLQAAVDALFAAAATCGSAYPSLFAEAGRQFPML
ncbi:hypothetical protein AB0D27_03300 [Streptomyces sp. NPDC048415]|uniref:hypothetical protein n=1 Tax=Streptomyces sp. NPDC048415 TaxID=3154822 RepID=UPI0034283203